MDNTQPQQGISAIPVSQPTLQKVAPGPQETVDSLTTKARWVLIVLLITFPPYAWYMMAKYRHYHGWIGNVIAVNGVLALLTGLSLVLFYVPTMISLQESLGTEGIGYSGFLPGIVMSIIFIIFGIYLNSVVKKQGSLNRLYLVLGIIAVIVSYTIPMITFTSSMMSVIQNSYRFTDL